EIRKLILPSSAPTATVVRKLEAPAISAPISGAASATRTPAPVVSPPVKSPENISTTPEPSPEAPKTPAQLPAEAPSAPPAAPSSVKASHVKDWAFEGKVYDMLTLRPVALADITLSAESSEDEGFKATTDEKGRYRLKVPENAAGYSASISHPDYPDRYF